MKRRLFLLVSALTLASPSSVNAQQRDQIKRLGVLFPGPPPQPTTEPFRLRARDALWSRLRSHGWIEGQNLMVERRYANGDLDRLPVLAAELVALKVDVIYATSGTAGLAAKNATSSTPIVTHSGDMVRQGLVASLARPGGNVTGQNLNSADVNVAAKRLDLLRELLGSHPVRVAVLGCGDFAVPDDTTKNWAWTATESAARTRKMQLQPYSPQTLTEIDKALRDASTQTDALLLYDCPYFNALDEGVFLQHRLPAMYPFEMFAHRGGLMAYGFDQIHFNHRHAWYIDRIFRGANPADLPIEQVKMRFVINLKTAKALGITVPQSLLLRADELIQ